MNIRYDIYRCLAQIAGTQERLSLYDCSLRVTLMRTSRAWSLL